MALIARARKKRKPVATLSSLKALGVQLSIDDFGSQAAHDHWLAVQAVGQKGQC